LIESLYGLSIAPRLWYHRLYNALLADGFTPGTNDECILFNPTMIIFLWVIDCGICAPRLSDIENFITQTKTRGFGLNLEGRYLGYTLSAILKAQL
jgi:hypothetical protein